MGTPRRCWLGEGEGAQGEEGRWKKGKDAGWQKLWKKIVNLKVNPTFPGRTHPLLAGSFFPKDSSGEICHWKKEKRMVPLLSREQPNEPAPLIQADLL